MKEIMVQENDAMFDEIIKHCVIDMNIACTEKVKYQNNKIGLVLEYKDNLKVELAGNWIIIKKDNKIIFEANMNFTLDLKPELKSFSDIFIKVDDETYILIVHKDKNFVFIELSKDYYECKTKQDAICKALDEL